MREKKWKDCPVCGAKDSMRVKKGLTERLIVKGYPPVEVKNLDGQMCNECGDGFWSLKSERELNRQVAEHMANYDANRTVVSELASVKEAAKTLHITAQGIHKMMNEGRLRYVVAGDTRLPIRKYVNEKAGAK